MNYGRVRYFSSDRFAESSFTVSHYAGRVTYDTATFLGTNHPLLRSPSILKSCLVGHLH